MKKFIKKILKENMLIESDLGSLEQDMHKAISNEDYEEAARIRDAIKSVLAGETNMEDHFSSDVIEFLEPHSLNFGEDLKYVATYSLGGNSIEDYRILTEGVNSGEKFLFFLTLMPNMFGQDRYKIDFIELNHQAEEITDDYIRTQGRNESYEYHKVCECPETVHELLRAWSESDPMVHLGNKFHNFISRIDDYNGTYRFQGITY